MSDDAPRAGGLEISGAGSGLLDERLMLRVRGGGPDLEVLWRARMQDDDGRVWRAQATRPEDLAAAWRPDKAPQGLMAALQSLRPVGLEVRVESNDRRAAKRMLSRQLMADGVRLRRWRDGLAATLCLPPPGAEPVATVILDATGGPEALAIATLAGPLLASRGVLALAVAPARRGGGDAIDRARERLAAVPGTGEPNVLGGEELVLPPGVPAATGGTDAALARAAAWDALLARLGARARNSGTPKGV